MEGLQDAAGYWGENAVFLRAKSACMSGTVDPSTRVVSSRDPKAAWREPYLLMMEA